jgi:hypothetical protein
MKVVNSKREQPIFQECRGVHASSVLDIGEKNRVPKTVLGGIGHMV